MDNNSDPDDIPILSSTALDALREFYVDRDAREKAFQNLKLGTLKDEPCKPPLTMEAFAENWNESQFWYSQVTATTLANQLLASSSRDTTIAIISAPSVFVQAKNLLAMSRIPRNEQPKIYLLEYDDRFSIFPEFIFYDFRNPLKLPPSMKGSVDRIICDPPFLSEDCETKTSVTVRWLSKSWGVAHSGLKNSSAGTNATTRLIICTGERMETLISKLYRPLGIATTTFQPIHEKGLSNEFYCYANFECTDWKWKT